jgi:hypothetical protein
MPLVKFRDQTGGMTPDVFPHKMEDNQYSMLFNYRNWKAAASKVGGQEIELNGMPIDNPNLIDFWNQQNVATNGYFMTAKGPYVYQTNVNGQDINISQNGAYTNVFEGTAIPNNAIWTSTSLYGGLTWITNNEFITPQYVTNNTEISPTGELQDLPGWIWNADGETNPYIAQTCKTIRSFDNQLWAANITKKRQDGTMEYYPNLILYSDKATNVSNTKYGYIPDMWQPSGGTQTRSSNWAGYLTIDTSDEIVDMMPLRDTLLVFTVNQIFIIPKLQTYQQVVQPIKFSEVRGLLSNECAVSFDGRILFVTNDDIILTTGSSIDFQSLANQRIKDTFFNDFLTRNTSWQKNVFVRYDRFHNEVWICFPSISSTDGSCNRALIWDVESNGWSLTELPGIYNMVYAPVIGNGTSTDNRPWSGFNYSFLRLQYQIGNKLAAQDIGYTRQWGSTTSYTTMLEKVYDLESMTGADKIKALNSIYPFIQGTTVATVELKFSNIPFSTGIDWSTNDYSGDFDTTIDYKIDPNRNGRYIAMRLITNDTNEHNFTSIDFDIDLLGRRG